MRVYYNVDLEATGKNIEALRKKRGISVKDLQDYFDFSTPQAIYKWQKGKTLPTYENLYMLALILGVRVDELIIVNKVAC